MAQFHLKVSTISRSKGRSAVAAAAYRTGRAFLDVRTGDVHDYRRKQGVKETFIAAPDGVDWVEGHEALWNAAEAAETRKNAVTAREWLIALPHELDAVQRTELARALATELVTRYGVVVDVAIHAPSREGDQRNHHAHLLCTTREATPEGFGKKTRILDAAKTGGPEIEAMRAWWADTVNDALAAAKRPERIDHRPKRVVVAELSEQAAALEAKIRAIAIVNASPDRLGGFREGVRKLGQAVRESGASILLATKATTQVLREKAKALRDRAWQLDGPPNRHDGPRLTAYKRRMAPIWKREQEEAAARRAAEAAERTRQAERAEEAREAARRAEEKRRQAEEMADRYAEVTLPLVQRARRDETFARRIEDWGIDLDRSDHAAARDPIWTMLGPDDGYGSRKLVWSALTDEARAIDQRRKEAEERHKQQQDAYARAKRERERQRRADREEQRRTDADQDPKPSPTPQPKKPEPGSGSGGGPAP